MATTSFADVPDDGCDFDIRRPYAEPPRGLDIHSSVYDDGECRVRVTFIVPVDLVPFVADFSHAGSPS